MLQLEERQELIASVLSRSPLRLNIGCGINHAEGYVNIDVQEVETAAGVTPDFIADAKNIQLPDACADEVMAIHVWEHFYRWDCEAVIAEWRRLLKIGGLLVLELPDMMKWARNILEGIPGDKHPDQLGLWAAYGDPRTKDPYMLHKWGWSEKSLRAFLEENGFAYALRTKTQHHPVGRARRDMRIEARKA